MQTRPMTWGQLVGGFILILTSLSPGLALAGFQGGTGWSLAGWLCVAIPGGFVGGFLLAPGHRFDGAIGGMIGAPLGMLALYLYASGRHSLYRTEAVLIWLLGTLPGVGTYFVLKFLTDALFPGAAKNSHSSESPFLDDDQTDPDDADDKG